MAFAGWAAEKQIPWGNDRKKSKGEGKNKGKSKGNHGSFAPLRRFPAGNDRKKSKGEGKSECVWCPRRLVAPASGAKRRSFDSFAAANSLRMTAVFFGAVLTQS